MRVRLDENGSNIDTDIAPDSHAFTRAMHAAANEGQIGSLKASRESLLKATDWMGGWMGGAAPAMGVVVHSPQELAHAVKQCESGGITHVTLKGGGRYTDADIQSLAFVHELSLLDLEQDSTEKLENLKSLLEHLKSLLPQLKSLNVGCKAESRQELARTLKACRDASRITPCKVTVVKLALRGNYTYKDLQGIPSSLLELEMTGPLPMGVISAVGLAHLNRLITLKLSHYYLDNVFRFLPPWLQELSVFNCARMVSDAGVPRLNSLRKLKSLVAVNCNFGDAEAEAIAANRTLCSVNLSDNYITGRGKRHLLNSSITSIELGRQTSPGIQAYIRDSLQVARDFFRGNRFVEPAVIGVDALEGKALRRLE